MLRAVLEGWKRAYRGSLHTEAAELLGLHNVAQIADRHGLTQVSMENLLRWQPDIILVQEAVTADFIRRDPLWQGVKAVAEQRILFLSGLPFGWLDAPPGINRLLGLRRLHARLDPAINRQFKSDMQHYAQLFWHCSLSDADYQKIGGELMRTVNGCILLLAAISITFAAVSGAYHLDMQQLLALILRQENVPVQEQIVFWQIRVPRILAALFLGAALAGAGTTYQGMFRNPLVSPDILGVSAGAGLGACAAILWGLSIVYIQLYAFCGGLMVVAGVWLITRRVTRHDPILTPGAGRHCVRHVVRSGDIANKNAGTDPYTQLPSITFWLLGGLSTVTLRDPLLCCTDHSHRLLAPVFSPLAHEFTHTFRRRSPFAGTERDTSALWIDCLRHTHHRQHGSNSGHNWLGRPVVPHIARLLTGHNHQQLLPMAMCTGAILLLLTDTLARSIGTTEIPLGILTAFVGAPFFLFLLLRGGRQ